MLGNSCKKEKGFTLCCKKCKGNPCYNHGVKELDELLYRINLKLCDYTEAVLCRSKWGYYATDFTADKRCKLELYKDSIQRHYNAVKFGYEASLCPDEIQKIIEKALCLVDNVPCGDMRCDIKIDRSGFDSWVLSNPGCVAFESWQRCLYNQTPLLRGSVSLIQPDIDTLMYNAACVLKGEKIDDLEFKADCVLTKEDVDKIEYVSEVKDLQKGLSTLRVLNEAIAIGCYDINYKINKNDCILKYNQLVEHQQCGLTLNQYTTLLDCHLSHEVMSTLYDCGFKINVDIDQKCPILTYGKSVINLCDKGLDIDSTIQPLCELEEITGFKISPKEIKETIQKIIDSYSESSVLNKRLNG